MDLKRKLTAALVTGGTLVALATPAMATVVYAGGGTWDYGVGGGKVWSYYLHNYNCHKSSVEGKIYVSSGNTPKGSWARASAEDRWYAADHSYYSNSC